MVHWTGVIELLLIAPLSLPLIERGSVGDWDSAKVLDFELFRY